MTAIVALGGAIIAVDACRRVPPPAGSPSRSPAGSRVTAPARRRLRRSAGRCRWRSSASSPACTARRSPRRRAPPQRASPGGSLARQPDIVTVPTHSMPSGQPVALLHAKWSTSWPVVFVSPICWSGADSAPRPDARHGDKQDDLGMELICDVEQSLRVTIPECPSFERTFGSHTRLATREACWQRRFANP